MQVIPYHSITMCIYISYFPFEELNDNFHFWETILSRRRLWRWHGFPVSREATSLTIIWRFPIIHDQIERSPIFYYLSSYLFSNSYDWMRRSHYYNLTASNRPWQDRTITSSLSFIFILYNYWMSYIFI